MQVLNDPQTELIERLIDLAGDSETLHRALESARRRHGAELTLEFLIAEILQLRETDAAPSGQPAGTGI